MGVTTCTTTVKTRPYPSDLSRTGGACNTRASNEGVVPLPYSSVEFPNPRSGRASLKNTTQPHTWRHVHPCATAWEARWQRGWYCQTWLLLIHLLVVLYCSGRGTRVVCVADFIIWALSIGQTMGLTQICMFTTQPGPINSMGRINGERREKIGGDDEWTVRGERDRSKLQRKEESQLSWWVKLWDEWMSVGIVFVI